MTNLPKNDYVNAFKPDRPLGPGKHVSEGSHTPDVPYAPSNPLAWGAKGAWGPAKTADQVSAERQAAETKSYVTQQGARRRGCFASSAQPAQPRL